ncbi:MAG: hypothetical protein IJH64_00700 [Oscillospiraceae bacterium]|nr:hypothetical protein [Oscillospiraceae bacterium]
MNTKFEDHSKEFIDAVLSVDRKTGDLFPESFMKENTSFSSLDSMINAFGNVESVEDLSNNTDWDKFVSVNSSFNNWDEMLGAAKENFIRSAFQGI